MQKFVKLKNKTSNAEEQASPHPSQVKLVGYLKKKRTKVGGWRKMWFVLQNQLLLSYPSKEDYDRKLIAFKDVLNLVPGTIVRPLGGYRFAIQTTSESVYIFRCDDNKTYMEWITALVDSLSIGSSAAKKKELTGGAMPKKPLSGSHSCSSLVRSKKNKSVHIPIAHGTARILNRTGLSENDLRAFFSNGCLLHDSGERANYFCLHDNQLLLGNQSNAVSRINRMFSGSASDVDLSSSIHASRTTSGTGLAQQATTSAKSMRSKGLLCESDGENSGRSAISRKMHEFLMFMRSDNLEMIANNHATECEASRDINSNTTIDFGNLLQSAAEDCDGNRDEARNFSQSNGIEDQIQRLSLRGSSRCVVADKKPKARDQEVSYLRLSSTVRTDESPFSRRRRRPEQGAGSSASSAGSCSSTERRNESSYNGDDSEIGGEEAKRHQQDEPIYAVVDLKNKYEHRAKMRHEMEARRRSQIGYLKSLDEVATDYEEVLGFPDEPLQNVTTYPYEDENIYEPINIPESSYPSHKHRNILWKYISRIRLDAFIEMTRSRKKNNKSSEHISPFANIKQKFGHHRKSIRIRMIKLYTREQPSEDIDDSTDAADNKPDQT